MEMLVPPLSQQAFELCPASSTSWDAEWHRTVCGHYGLHGCIILSQIFPETHKWFCNEFPQSYFDFCVSEHIYHKKQARGAKALGIEIADPRNGLPLLKHFEVLYQDGDMTLLPCREENPLAQERNTIRVQIHIAEKFHNTFLQWVYAKTKSRKTQRKSGVFIVSSLCETKGEPSNIQRSLLSWESYMKRSSRFVLSPSCEASTCRPEWLTSSIQTCQILTLCWTCSRASVQIRWTTCDSAWALVVKL